MTLRRQIGGRDNSGRIDLRHPDEVGVIKHTQHSGARESRSVYLRVRLGSFELSVRVKDPETLRDDLDDAEAWTRETAA